MNYTLQLIASIRESTAQRNMENESNKENQPQLIRPASVAKIDKSLKPMLIKSSST
jgi:hypothetical protein